ncbi:MAG: hypothetical protein NXI20_10105 [bacterium]|nr:hypothetical protein [bacterium]
MSRIVLTAILLVSPLFIFGQKVQKVNEQLRTLTFFDLKNDSNRSFHKYQEEIPRILIDALEQGKIQAYEVSDSSQVSELSFDEFKKRTQIPGFEEDPFDDWGDDADSYYLDSEISMIGLDETIGIKKKKRYKRINYISLYVPEYVTYTGLRTYLASFRFEDFAKICSEEGYLWYQPELFYYWNSNGFTNLHSRYFFESKAGNELITLIKAGKIKGFHKDDGPIDLDINFSNKYSDYPRFEIMLREPKGIPFKNTVIDIYYNPDGYYGSYNIQYLVSCNTSDFGNENSEVLNFSDAILSNLLTPLVNQYTNQLERDTISINGTLKMGLPDPEYDPKGVIAQIPSELQIKKFTNNQISRIDLYDSINDVLVQEGQEISRYLMEAIDAGKLEIYWSDALEKQMTKEEYTEAITMVEPDYDPFADPFENNDDEAYLYSPLSLTIFLLSQKAEFDLKSGEKLLNPYAIGMTIRADDSPYGLDQTVGWLNVNDVKNLLTDKKAEATFFGEKLNYYDILMSDKIISYFQIGSHIKVLKN